MCSMWEIKPKDNNLSEEARGRCCAGFKAALNERSQQMIVSYDSEVVKLNIVQWRGPDGQEAAVI